MAIEETGARRKAGPLVRQRHAHAGRGLDLYETDPVAVHALLHAECLPRRIWECAAGRGAIVNVLRAAGHEVIASDIQDHGGGPFTPASYLRRDFLTERQAPEGCEAVVTNPPFKLAAEFADHAQRLVPQVYLLLRLAFLESTRRTALLESGTLRRVYVFRDRLPMMHRDGWGGPRNSSATAYAWFVWDRRHAGPTELRRISWRSP